MPRYQIKVVVVLLLRFVSVSHPPSFLNFQGNQVTIGSLKRLSTGHSSSRNIPPYRLFNPHCPPVIGVQ